MVVYLVPVHKNPGQVLRLLRRLQTDTTSILVHIDARADDTVERELRRGAAGLDRVGLGGRPFRLIKFRTMAANAPSATELHRVLDDPALKAELEQTHKLANDPRVTRFGRFLRRLSFDELPQLVNVLIGDMSLVGPRPITHEELERYGDEQQTLLSFRPGVTGYWQINGRSRTNYEDRVRLDIAYVRGWSLELDFLILGKTAWVLLTGHGAY